MIRYLNIRRTDTDWCVVGEGINFYVSCDTYEDAVFTAKFAQNNLFLHAIVIDDTLEEVTREQLRAERRERLEWRDQMRSDLNE